MVSTVHTMAHHVVLTRRKHLRDPGFAFLIVGAYFFGFKVDKYLLSVGIVDLGWVFAAPGSLLVLTAVIYKKFVAIGRLTLLAWLDDCKRWCMWNKLLTWFQPLDLCACGTPLWCSYILRYVN